MRDWRRWLAAAGIASAMACASCPAQISLSSAVTLALKSDPRVGMAQANLDKARAALAEAHDAYVPSAGISGGDGKSTGVPTSLPVVFSVSAESLLFTFSQRDYIRAAHAGVDAASLALDEAHDQVTEDVINTYTSLDNAERRRDAMAQEYGFAARLVSITEERLAAGADTRMEVLRNRRAAAQIRLEQLRVEDEVAELSDHLARLIGLPGNVLATVSSSIPALPAPEEAPSAAPDTPGLRSAMANVRAKQETAFGDSRYRFRPQVSFGANYSRISTLGTNYAVYYPGFSQQNLNSIHASLNALSLGIQIQIPFYDKAHSDRGHESAAEARRVAFEADNQRTQFLEGRFKLGRSAVEAAARADVARADVEIAQAQIDAVLAQLSPDAGNPDRPQLSPKDEQSTRLQERQKYVEMLDAEMQLTQAQVSLLRQTGQLQDWLKASVTGSSSVVATPVTH